MHVHQLNICLNNGRNYVQAVQMVAEAAKVMQAAGHRLQLLESFGFRRITRNQVGVVFDSEAGPDARPAKEIGEVSFLGPRGSQQAWFIELEHEAPRAVIPDGIAFTRTASPGHLSGSFRFTCSDDLLGLLVVTTQTVKSLHAELGPHVSDIWLTGMRRAAFSCTSNGGTVAGEIEVKNLRVLGGGGQKQTLSEVAMVLTPQSTRLAALVTFAYKE